MSGHFVCTIVVADPTFATLLQMKKKAAAERAEAQKRRQAELDAQALAGDSASPTSAGSSGGADGKLHNRVAKTEQTLRETRDKALERGCVQVVCLVHFTSVSMCAIFHFVVS